MPVKLRNRATNRLAAPWLRMLAALCAGMVLLLSAATTSTTLHSWLHAAPSDHDTGHACAHAHANGDQAPNTASSSDDNAATPGCDTGHRCAITLFSHGVTSASVLVTVLNLPVLVPETIPATHQYVAPPKPRHLRPQPQAPPIA